MSEWKECKLSEIATIVDCEHKTAPLVEASKYISVRTSNIKNGRIDFDNANRVSYDTYLGWTKRMAPNEGDIILAREAPVGEVGYVLKNKKVCLGQRTVLIKPNNEYIDPKYLLYYLTNGETKYDLISRSTGSVVEHLNVKDIKDYSLTIIESLPKQRAIASILSSLDDKIDLLHRQNKTLEAMAETLFRQWFVEAAEEGWVEKTLFSIAEHKKYNVKPDQNPATIYHHYSIPAFDDGKQPIKELGSEIKSNKYQVVPNSILISKLNPRFPRVWAITDLMDDNSICSTEFQVVYPTSTIYQGFIYRLLKSKQVTGELIGAAGGTSGSHQRVKPEDIFNLSFQMPPDERIVEFNLITSDHLKKVSTNTKQIRTLEKLRDTLLPKLMSGEVRVKSEQREAGT